MENCRFENVSGPAIVIAVENNSNTDVTLRMSSAAKSQSW